MRKISVLVFPFLLLLLISSPTLAALSNGNYVANLGGFSTGTWNEAYSSNTPNDNGNMFSGTDLNSWNLSGFTQIVTDSQVPVTVNYSQGTLSLNSNGPWWSGLPGFEDIIIPISSLTRTSTESGSTPKLSFLITGNGTSSMGQKVTFTGTFVGDPNLQGLPLARTGRDGPFSTAEITITPIPGAVWLLASGLFGLVGIRRKLRQ